MRTALIGVFVVAALLSFLGVKHFGRLSEMSGSLDSKIERSPWKFDFFLPVEECPEPSGIAFYPERGTFLLVDDGAIGRKCALYEMRLSEGEDGRETEVVAKLPIGKDLEGVCVNPTNGRIYICDEKGELIYEIDSGGKVHLRTFQVDRDFEGVEIIEKGSDGFEGITFRQVDGEPLGGWFYIANQNDPTCVIRVSLPEEGGEVGGDPVEVGIDWVYKGKQINLGEVMWHEETGTLWLSHAWQNLLEVINPDTGELVGWETLPGAAQEGIAIDELGRLWIAQDIGGIAVYTRE